MAKNIYFCNSHCISRPVYFTMVIASPCKSFLLFQQISLSLSLSFFLSLPLSPPLSLSRSLYPPLSLPPSLYYIPIFNSNLAISPHMQIFSFMPTTPSLLVPPPCPKDLYPYGTNAGDQVLVRDGRYWYYYYISNTIDFTSGAPFGSRKMKYAHVSGVSTHFRTQIIFCFIGSIHQSDLSSGQTFRPSQAWPDNGSHSVGVIVVRFIWIRWIDLSC